MTVEFPQSITISVDGRIQSIQPGRRPNAPISLAVLGNPSQGGIWFPDEFIGLQTVDSSPVPDHVGSYVCCADRERIYQFALKQTLPIFNTTNAELWISDEFNNWQPTGVTIKLVAGELLCVNDSDSITLYKGYSLSIRLDPAFGYSPMALQLSALREDIS